MNWKTNLDWKRFNPWNWFKHEESETRPVPVRRYESASFPSSPLRSSNPLWQLHNEVDRLFESIWRGFGTNGADYLPDSLWGQDFHPAVNVSSKGDNYEITLEAPGLDIEDLSVEQTGDRLVIRGEKREEQEDSDRQYYRMESRYGVFQRVLSLPEDADASGIEASMKKGVLRLTVPRTVVPESKARRIEIKPT